MDKILFTVRRRAHTSLRNKIYHPRSFLLFLFVPSQFTFASFAWLLSSARHHHHRQLLLCSGPFFAPTQEGERECVCICVRFLFFFPAAQQFTTVVAPYIHLVSFCLQSEVPSTLTNVILQLLLTLRAQCSFISHKFCASVADRHYCTD